MTGTVQVIFSSEHCCNIFLKPKILYNCVCSCVCICVCVCVCVCGMYVCMCLCVCMVCMCVCVVCVYGMYVCVYGMYVCVLCVCVCVCVYWINASSSVISYMCNKLHANINNVGGIQF